MAVISASWEIRGSWFKAVLDKSEIPASQKTNKACGLTTVIPVMEAQVGGWQSEAGWVRK
jgi:hypothetical protein